MADMAEMIDIAPAATSTDWRHATALLHDYVEWLRAALRVEPLKEQPEIASELGDLRRRYAGPDGALFVARDGGDPVGIVAVRDHGDGTAELKRMYVRPVARGRGIADRLVTCVLRKAAAYGCHTVWLETLRGPMDRAIAVYRRNGFAVPSEPSPTLALDDVVVMERRLPAGLALGSGCGGY